jgi:hypothetical protein
MIPITIGIMLERTAEEGYQTVNAHAAIKLQDEDFPRWPTEAYIDQPELNKYRNLILPGFASRSLAGGFRVERARYRGLHEVQLTQARTMADMLAKIEKDRLRSESEEAGDVFDSFARSLRAHWVCSTRSGVVRPSMDGANWEWLTVAQGRNRYRWLIDVAIRESAMMEEMA